jgi:hypothetical protein
MLRFLSILVLAASAIPGEAADEPPKENGVLSLLPDGSELKGVMVPRYDENHKMTASLKADKIILVNADQIAGTGVAMEMFNPDQTQRARIDMIKVLFYKHNGLLTSQSPVVIKSEKINATGTGLYYYLDQKTFVQKDPNPTAPPAPVVPNPSAGKGFLLGPVTSTIQLPPKKKP